MRKVLVFGTFDVLHPGHIHFLKQAREHGDYLVASIARDSFVGEWKGKAPVHKEEARRQHVLSTGLVDEAVLGDEVPGTYSLIRKIQPDIVCLGYDQAAFRKDITAWLRRNSPGIEVAVLDPYKPDTYKSSKLKAEVYRTVEEASPD